MKKADPYHRRLFYAGIALSCVVLAFALAFLSYFQRLNVTLREENGIRLSEVSEHVASYLYRLVEEQETQLKIAAISVEMMPEAADRVAYLGQIAQENGFEYIGIAGPSGVLYSSAFSEPKDVSGEAYFQAACRGQTYMTDVTRHIFMDRAVGGVIVAVPIPGGDGAIAGFTDITKLSKEVQVESFNGSGYSYVIDRTGDVVLHARSMEYNNFFQFLRNMEFDRGYSLKKMITDIQEQREGLAAYTQLGVEKYAYYRPLQLNGWTVVSTVPKGVITEKTAALTKAFAILCLGAVLAFLCLLTIVCILFIRLESRRRANQAKSAFLANMSHDMRTPMNAIIGMTAIAVSHADDSETVQDCLQKIMVSSQHLLGLINAVLDMSRIESGKLTLKRENLYLPDVVAGTLNMTYHAMREKGQHFSIRLHNVTQEFFYGDTLRLTQIFTNIITNAVKFTPEGGQIQIEIAQLPSSQPGKAAFQFTFTDNGIGMKPEFLNKVFTPFAREQDSKVDKIEGTGLGMAIVKRIVDLMGGTITVASEEGKGTTFVVTLTLSLDTAANEEPVKLPDRVLVADMDAVELQESADTLKRLGAEAACCTDMDSLAEQIQCAHSNGTAYEAVLIDRELYEANGLSALTSLDCPLPKLILTAYEWEDIHHAAREAGISGFAQKPLFPSVLGRALGKLDTPKALGETAPQNPDFTGKTVLIVEDNELNREIAQSLLEELGASVVCAEDGQACVQRFQDAQAGDFDLILMDIQMPVMNGYEATRAIRSLSRGDASIPIIAMSANAFVEDINAALESGMNGYLTKPIDVAAWMRELEKHLSPNSGHTIPSS